MTTVLANARLVLPESVMQGMIVVEDGRIAELRPGDAVPTGALDMDGDLILPGLIDIHTDHLERHYVPRPNTIWDPLVAVQAHDAQIIGAGITTVFDCLALSGVKHGIDRATAFAPLLHAIEQAGRLGALRADHLIHLRCELTDESVPERAASVEGHPRVRLMSMMDHSPGDRQFPDMEMWMQRQRLSTGLSEDALLALRDQRLAAQMHVADRRAIIAAQAARNGLALASHDDATVQHVAAAHALGVQIAEFPTSIEAAQAAHDRGIAVLMGAPNLARGGSHVGNLSACECAQAGLLSILGSDYVPASLLPAAMMLTRAPLNWTLPRAIQTITASPAQVVGLTDRGRIAPGLRADLARVRLVADIPVIRDVWREGYRVH